MSLIDFFPMTSAMRPEQERALNWIESCVLKGYRDIVVAAPTGCHGWGQKVLLFTGQAIAVQDVRVGDLLMGPDSMPRKVLELVRGEGEMYNCNSDIGSTFTANDQHVLSLNRRSVVNWGKHGHWHKHGIEQITLADYLKADKAYKVRFRLWRAKKPINFPEKACTVWYGHKAYDIAFDAARSGEALPRAALIASVYNRRELLAGFYDAIGYVRTGPTYGQHGVVLCASDSREIIDNIEWLAASMGWGMNRWRDQGWRNDGRFCGSLFTPMAEIPLRRLRVPIKQSTRMAANRGKVTAIHIGRDKFFGFKVEGDGLYLLDDFIVHHNSGKTAMGIAFANWMAHRNPVELTAAEEAEEREAEDARNRGLKQEGKPLGIVPGGYYLCTQKMLQDQITDDILKLKPGLNKVVTLKTAAEYPCMLYGNCGTGAICKKKGKCPPNACAYQRQKALFLGAHVGVTNYAYLMTERSYSGMFPKRRSLICDEAHNVATGILRFVELSVNQKILDDLTPGVDLPRRIETMEKFTDWVRETYVPALNDHLEIASDLAENGTDEQAQIAAKIDAQLKKIAGALATCGTRSEWVFWDVRDEESGKLEYIARPVESAPFAEDVVLGAGQVRLYMSAYPGVKDVFARDLGLHRDDIAWANLKSTFPPERRRVIMMPVVSLSKSNRQNGLPGMLRMLERIFDRHAKHKGLIHVHSYEFGEAVYRHFSKTIHGRRLLFPRNADDRDTNYALHRDSTDPTVILTPSMTEGYDFAGPLARWQVLLKCPYASLGDKQTVARMEKDADWYDLQAVSTLIQAAGRGMRSEDDFCVTYSFDSDTVALYRKRLSFFPRWFQDAVLIHE